MKTQNKDAKEMIESLNDFEESPFQKELERINKKTDSLNDGVTQGERKDFIDKGIDFEICSDQNNNYSIIFFRDGKPMNFSSYRNTHKEATEICNTLNYSDRLVAENKELREALQMICDSGCSLSDTLTDKMLSALKLF